MSHFVFFGLQVGERMRRRVDLTWNLFDHLDASVSQALVPCAGYWSAGERVKCQDRGGSRPRRLKSLKSALNPSA